LVFFAPFGSVVEEYRMLALGVSLLLFGSGAAEVVPGPRLVKGDELHYVGEVVETSNRVENPYRKAHSLEVRLFVLESDDTAAICALLTVITRDADPALAPGMANIARRGPQKAGANASAKLEFVRIDSRGIPEFLDPPAGSLPIRFEKAQRRAVPAMTPDGLPQAELGFLVRTPTEGATLGTPWILREANRTIAHWDAKPHGTWNGRRCWEVSCQRGSENYDRPDVAINAWRSTEILLASPAEGLASSVKRETVRRFGNEQIGKIEVKYEVQPANRFVGTRYAEARLEIETAWAMTAEFEAILGSPAKGKEYTALASKIQRYLEDHQGSHGYRTAVAALKRRADSLSAGSVPYVGTGLQATAGKSVSPLALGDTAPDFIAEDVDLRGNRFRLHAAKGKPVVLVFYKANSATSKDALTIAEALSKRYRETATVVPLAIASKPEDASTQRAELKFSVPVFGGIEVRRAYRVETFPQFILVDGKGKIHWTFDAGVGPEVGFLVKEALDKLLAGAETK